MSCLSPVGPTRLRKLDASVGASGPRDFAVRCNISRPLAVDRSQVFQLALQSHRAQNAAASTAPLPASVTIMIRPSCGVGWREQHQAFDLVGTALDLAGIVGEVNTSDHEAALHRRG